MSSKTCSVCSEVKDSSEFYPSDRHYCCKLCRYAQVRKRHDSLPYLSTVNKANYRARRIGVRGCLTHQDVVETYERAGFACECCGSTENLSIDHVIPMSKGGPNTKHNLQILCRSDNSKKSKKAIDYRR